MRRVGQCLPCLLLLVVNFGQCGARHFLGAGKTSGTPSATAYSEAAERDGSQYVELLRFVTPYGTGFETIADVTPFSPLLRAGELSFFNFIDTWVGNATNTWSFTYLDNVTGECSSEQGDDGNGWAVKAELVFWQSSSVTPVQPRSTVFLASGQNGARFPIGDVKLNEGTLFKDGSIALKQGVDPQSLIGSQVYRCPGGASELQLGRRLGYLQHRAELAARYNRTWDEVELLANNIFASLARSSMIGLEVFALDDELTNMSVMKAHYDRHADVQEGMPVFYSLGVVTDAHLYADFWMNTTYPMEPVGQVVWAANGTMLVSLNTTCMPAHHRRLSNGSETGYISGPGLVVPQSPGIFKRIKTLINQTQMLGVAASLDPLSIDFAESQLRPTVLAIKNHRLQPEEVLGHVLLTEDPGSTSLPAGYGREGPAAFTYFGRNPARHAANSKSEEQVCLVTRSTTGRFLERAYELPELKDGEEVVLQLVVTGHGWETTTEQCGEYCHAVYRLRLNGQSAANVTQWRNDCHLNPTGHDQHGTWEESRNGWCPGSMQPGVFITVTDYVRSGANTATLDLDVWSNVTRKYESYGNIGGFAHDDYASLSVSLALFVYEPEVVAAVKDDDFMPYSLAEKAIKNGCSHPDALQPPDVPTTQIPVALLIQGVVTDMLSAPEARRFRAAAAFASNLRRTHQAAAITTPGWRKRNTTFVHHHYEAAARSARTSVPATERFDFEERAPWYSYDEAVEGKLGGGAGDGQPVRVPIFEGAFSQGSSRVVTASVPADSIPESWSQVALHFKLAKPPGKLKFDAWDRKGTFGMQLSKSSDVSLVNLDPPSLKVTAVRAMPRFDQTKAK